VGEAGGIAPLHSLVADLHDVSCRARAFAILQLGGPIGMFVAFCGGGLIAQSFEWRVVFFVAGGLGVVVGLLVLWGLPEPRRRKPMPREAAPFAIETGLGSLLAQAGFRWLLAGTAFAGIGFYATLTWAPSFLARSFSMTVGNIGLVLGIGFGVFGIISVLSVGIVCDRLRMTRPNAYAVVAACAVGAAAAFGALGLLLPSEPSSLVVFVITVMGLSAWQVPMIAAVQEYAGPGNRAGAAALFMLAINLGGMGVGPTLVGVLSDVLSGGSAQESLRYALLVVPLALAGASACWLRAARLRPMSTFC
jgi:predicted MFS family arabinose efflux permease